MGHTRVCKDEISWIHSDGVEQEENHVEAHKIIRTLCTLPNSHSVMILSPYRAQCEILTQLCNSYIPHVKVMTLDSVQGHEADIIVVSLVKSNPASFLTKKRTCVLVSRAREKLILFGNRQGSLSSKNGLSS